MARRLLEKMRKVRGLSQDIPPTGVSIETSRALRDGEEITPSLEESASHSPRDCGSREARGVWLTGYTRENTQSA